MLHAGTEGEIETRVRIRHMRMRGGKVPYSAIAQPVASCDLDQAPNVTRLTKHVQHETCPRSTAWTALLARCSIDCPSSVRMTVDVSRILLFMCY